MKPFVSFLSILIHVSCLSFFSFTQQAYYRISGDIQDNDTHEPVPFASIGIKGKAIGTVSNIKGDFSFSVPLNCLNDTLFVSSIGYARFNLIIKGNSIEKICLHRQSYSLKEVTVKPLWDNPRKIIKEALHRISDNGPDKPFLCSAYYRVLVKEDSLFAAKGEATLTINDSGEEIALIPGMPLHKEFRIDELRLSKNNIINPKIIHESDLNSLYHLNSLKIYKFISKHDICSLDSVCYFDNELVYSISCTIQGSSNSKIYITVKDFAFIKVVRKYNGFSYPHNFKYPDTDSLFWSSNDSSVMMFSRINDKWYPKYYYIHHWRKFSRYEDKDFKPFLTSEDISELLVTNVYPGKKINIPKKDKVDQFVQILRLKKDYHPEFWKNYNVILPDPFEIEVQIDFKKREEYLKSK